MRVNGDDRGADSPSSARPLSTSAQPSPMRNLSSASGGLYVSAPGKIILFGEHAVVYGRTAIAGSIDLRTYVSLFTSADGRIYLSLPDLGVEKTWMLKDLLKAGERLAAEYPVDETQAPSLELLVPVARKLSGSCEDQCGVQHLAILAFWYVLLGVAHRKSAHKLNAQEGDGSADSSMDLLAVKTTVRFELPSCVGLGSSGAFCVCIVTSLLQSSGLIPPPSIVADGEGNLTWEEEHLDTIRKWATAAESLIHGRASGLDAAVCTYGGVATFKPGTRIEHLRNLPDLRVILVNSKVERNTSRMVQTVKERMKRFPEVVDGVFHSIDAISREAATILGKAVGGSDHEGENGEGAGGGDGTSAPPTPLLLNGGTQPPELDHRSLQPHSGSVRSASLSSYISAGKRDSCASALSGCSTMGGGGSGREKGELVDTFAKLNELCRMNNQLLIALGVGHPKVDQICTLLARYGIHPKMTGAGGGGSVFAFLKPDTPATLLDMITSELVKLGYDVWQPPLGGPGVVEHARRPALFSVPVASAPGAAAAAGSSSCGGSSGASALSTPSLHHK